MLGVEDGVWDMSDEERPRRSWREIDRNKDRSSHRREDRRDAPAGRGPRREKSYRATLDRLFDSGKIGALVEQKTGVTGDSDNRIKALARVNNATDRDDLTAAVDAYLQKFDALPDDLELLGRLLEHRDPSRQIEAMERIDKLLDLEQPKRTRAMLGQLRMIRDIGDDDEMVDLARRLIDRLE